MARSVSLYWFRQDLRLSDNPALIAAAEAGAVLPVYILDDDHAGDHKMGSASRWWLHHSLQSLNDSLDGKLLVLKGRSGKAPCCISGSEWCKKSVLEPVL